MNTLHSHFPALSSLNILPYLLQICFFPPRDNTLQIRVEPWGVSVLSTVLFPILHLTPCRCWAPPPHGALSPILLGLSSGAALPLPYLQLLSPRAPWHEHVNMPALSHLER